MQTENNGVQSTPAAKATEAKSASILNLAHDAKGAVEVVSLDADKVVLITDKKNPLYDERIEKPLNKLSVENYASVGQITAGTVAKLNGEDTYTVIDGKRRLLYVRAANELRKKAGLPALQYRATVVEGSTAYLAGLMLAANVSEPESVLSKLRKVEAMIKGGSAEAEVARVAGIDMRTLARWRTLSNCHPDVLKALEAGLIGVNIAIDFATLPQGEQAERLARAMAKAKKEVKPGTKPSKVRATANKHAKEEVEEGKKANGKSKAKAKGISHKELLTFGSTLKAMLRAPGNKDLEARKEELGLVANAILWAATGEVHGGMKELIKLVETGELDGKAKADKK